MKKLFTLLSVAALSVASCLATPAMPNITGKKWIASPEVEQTLREQSAMLLTQDIPEGVTKTTMKRSYVDATGNTWTVMLAYSGFKITDVWKFSTATSDSATFEDVPFYVVEYAVSKMDKTGTREVFCDLLCSWPSYRMWSSNQEDEFNYDIVSLVDMGKSQQLDNCATFAYFDATGGNILFRLDDSGKQALAWGIWSNEYNYDSQTGSTKATQVYKTYNAVLTTPSAAKMTQFVIKDFEPETVNLQTDFQLFLTYGSGEYSNTMTNQTPAITCQYDGKARVMGFMTFDNVYELDNIHIFNLGRWDQTELSSSEDPYNFDWEPVNKLYICTGTDLITPELDPAAKLFTKKCVTFNWVEGTPQELKQTDMSNIITGAMFAAEDPTEELPYGIYKMQSTDDVRPNPYYPSWEDVYVVPLPYTILPREVYNANMKDYYDWSVDDGMESIWEGYYWLWRNESKHSFSGIEIGTTEGTSFYGKDSFGNTYHGNTKGKIVYHYDPTDVQKTRIIEAVGPVISGVKEVVAPQFGVNAANGQITVTSENAADVAVYNLAGMMVASGKVSADNAFAANVAKGVYVVKVGKNAKKVVL